MNGLSNRLTLGFASLAHTYSHMFVLFYATVVLVLEREWGLPYAQLFALSIPGAVLFGACALPAGWLGDKWSASGMMAVFFLGTGAASIYTGLTDSALTLSLGLSLIGVFASIYHPVGIPWLVKHAINRGRALGVNGVFGSAGTAAAAIVAGVLTEAFGWRAAFIAPGVICIATGILFVIAIRAGLIIEGEQDAAPTPAPTSGDMKRAFAMLAVTVTCTGLIYQSTSYALPKIFDERLSAFVGDSLIGIGGLVTLCYLVSGLTQLIGGELADRYSQKAVYAWTQVLQVPLYILAFGMIHPALVGAAVVMISLNVMGQPAENSLMARYTPLKWRGRAFGIKFVLTLGVSAIGVAMIPVIHAAAGSLDILFLALMAFAALAFAAAIMLPSAKTTLAKSIPAPAGDD